MKTGFVNDGGGNMFLVHYVLYYRPTKTNFFSYGPTVSVATYMLCCNYVL